MSVNAIKIGELIIQMLDRGAQTSTYKYAVMLAILDLCIEKNLDTGTGATLQTPEIALKVTELYWPQVRVYTRGQKKNEVLHQISGKAKQAKIITLIQDFVDQHSACYSFHLAQGKSGSHAGAFHQLISKIENILIRMPLPKLQRIDNTMCHFLYEINWDDNVHVPAAYFRGEKSNFDNTMRLLPGVAQALREINGLVRPYIQKEWTRKVADLNNLPEIQLEHFLFDNRRLDLTLLRKPLIELQFGQCFYSGEALKPAAEVDHFIPWARSPNDDIFNLVVANRHENNSKRDFFADVPHLSRWLHRNVDQAEKLNNIALQKKWICRPSTSTCIAKNLYEKLPEGTLLWSTCDEKNKVDKRKLAALLERFQYVE